MIKGKEGEEVKNIIKNNNYYITSPSFLCSENVSSEKKKRILNFLSFLLKKKVIVKGEKEENVILQSMPAAKEIEKEGEEKEEWRDAGYAAATFLKAAKIEGWKEGENKYDLENLKEEIEKLNIEKEEVERKLKEANERAEIEMKEKEKEKKRERRSCQKRKGSF